MWSSMMIASWLWILLQRLCFLWRIGSPKVFERPVQMNLHSWPHPFSRRILERGVVGLCRVCRPWLLPYRITVGMGEGDYFETPLKLDPHAVGKVGRKKPVANGWISTWFFFSRTVALLLFLLFICPCRWYWNQSLWQVYVGSYDRVKVLESELDLAIIIGAGLPDMDFWQGSSDWRICISDFLGGGAEIQSAQSRSFRWQRLFLPACRYEEKASLEWCTPSPYRCWGGWCWCGAGRNSCWLKTVAKK